MTLSRMSLAAILPLLALGACVSPEGRLQGGAQIAASTADCAGAACYFRNSPVALQPKPVTIPGRPYEFYPTARELAFVDGGGRDWVAPTATLTDGASIPPVFVPIVGSPRTREFANAAALHDAWCGVGNEDGANYHKATWQEVHRMFYDSLIVGGTDDVRAKVMFAAVWLGGPRWSPISRAPDTRLDRLPAELRRDAMRRAKTYIERENPPIRLLIPYLHEVERGMFQAVAREGADGQDGTDPNEGYEGYPPVAGAPGPVGAVQQ